MEEMMKMYAMQSGGEAPDFPVAYSMTVNNASPLIARLGILASDEPAKAEMMASMIYRLSMLSQRKLSAEELSTFLSECYALLGTL